MTEVPDHLLARSRARRAALGLGGDGGGDAPPPSGGDAGPGTEVEPAATAAPAKAAAVTPAEAAPAPPEPLPPYVEAAIRRKRVPYWVMPVLAFMPVWAVLYAQSLTPPETKEKSQLDLGAEVYAAKCSSCHGGAGGGGVGRKLSDGEVVKTFPNIEQQMQFIAVGTAGHEGQPYGDPNREGGAHVGGTFGNAKMPAFGESLKPEELLAVARHERETLGGEKVAAKQIDAATATRVHADGKPYLSASKTLITSDGKPLFDEKYQLTNPEVQYGSNAGASEQAAG